MRTLLDVRISKAMRYGLLCATVFVLFWILLVWKGPMGEEQVWGASFLQTIELIFTQKSGNVSAGLGLLISTISIAVLSFATGWFFTKNLNDPKVPECS